MGEAMSAKMSLVLGFLMSAVLAGQVPAAAVSPALSLDPITGPPTTQVDVVGTGFLPAEVVDLAFGAKARGTVSADENGAFSATIRVPRSATAGAHDVTATGETSALVAIATFTVVTPSIALGRTSGPPRVNVDVTGANFPSLEPVEVAFDGVTLVDVTADQTGAFSTTLRVPTSASSGPHDVTATGAVSELTARAAFTVRIDRWSQYGFNAAHSGRNPREDVLDVSNVGDLTSAWTATLETSGGLAEAFSSPAVVKGVAYIGAENGDVYAIDAWTGEILWRAPGRVHHWSSPAVAKGVVYVGGGSLLALRASTGAVLWRLKTGDDTWSPAVIGGHVYVSTKTGVLYALRASDGSILWTKGLGDTADTGTGAAPSVSNGIVYEQSASQDLYALDADTGEVLWTAPMGEDAGVAPTVIDGVAYVPSRSHLWALDASAGTVLWSAAVEGETGLSSPAVEEGTVFLGGGQGLYAFDAATGALSWVASLGYSSESSPAVANGVVYVGGNRDPGGPNGNVYAVDAINGHILWSAAIGAEGRPDPRVLNGMVYTGSEDGRVYAFALP
jgi:outer membrane protein assembly factor BamB